MQTAGACSGPSGPSPVGCVSSWKPPDLSWLPSHRTDTSHSQQGRVIGIYPEGKHSWQTCYTLRSFRQAAMDLDLQSTLTKLSCPIAGQWQTQPEGGSVGGATFSSGFQGEKAGPFPDAVNRFEGTGPSFEVCADLGSYPGRSPQGAEPFLATSSFLRELKLDS